MSPQVKCRGIVTRKSLRRCGAARERIFLFWRVKRSDVRIAIVIESMNCDATAYWKNGFRRSFLSGHFIANDVTNDFLPGRSRRYLVHCIERGNGKNGFSGTKPVLKVDRNVDNK